MHPEQILQVNLMSWIEHTYPEIIDDVYHFAGERKCSIQQGRLLKRMGVKSGVSDLFICVSRETFKGLWVELKEGNGKPSQAQKEFLSRMTARGYLAVFVTGLEAAQAVIKEYLSHPPYSHGKCIC